MACLESSEWQKGTETQEKGHMRDSGLLTPWLSRSLVEWQLHGGLREPRQVPGYFALRENAVSCGFAVLVRMLFIYKTRFYLPSRRETQLLSQSTE